MKTKEEYYNQVLENRRLAADMRAVECTCPNVLCDWHGKCRECVALHRYHGDHIPVCLQPVISEKLKALVQVAEMVAIKKEDTPIEYRRYVKERDEQENSRLGCVMSKTVFFVFWFCFSFIFNCAILRCSGLREE